MRLYALLMSMSIAAGMGAVDMNHLYIVGPAATAGQWTSELPEEMVSVGYGIFVWDGYMDEGEFKFLNRIGDYDSSLVASEPDQKVESGKTCRLIDNSSGQNNYDFKYVNTEAGPCRMIVHMSADPMTLTFRRPVVRMIGSAVKGWGSPSKNIPVFADDNGVVEWTGLLQAGELKFLLGNDWSPCYNASTPDCGLTDGRHALVYHDDYSDDYKFIVPRQGRYTLRFDTREPSVTVTAHGGPSLAGAFSAPAGRYVVAADRNGRHLYFGAVPRQLFLRSFDGVVNRLQPSSKSGDVFTGNVYLEKGNYYKLYSDEACRDENCFSPNADVDISSGVTCNIAPMHGYSYTVPHSGYYTVKADFSGDVPSLTVQLQVTGVEAVDSCHASVAVVGREIIVTGEYDDISITDMYGRIVSTQSRTVVAPGVYIVDVDFSIFKILVK